MTVQEFATSMDAMMRADMQYFCDYHRRMWEMPWLSNSDVIGILREAGREQIAAQESDDD